MKFKPAIWFAISLMAISGGRAQTYLDTIIFGNTASEVSHSFVGPDTIVDSNDSISPPQTARRGSTNNPATVNGGSLTFNLAVDPVWRNYFTVKLWGGDDYSSVYEQDSDMGRLYLYVAASNFVAGANTNYQIGYRHEGDYICLNAAAFKPPLPGRFFYSTTLLPLWMTHGRTNLTFSIQPAGRIYDLGSGGPPDGNYQFNMITNSRDIYQAYTHIDPYLNPVGEVQGTAPATSIRPTPTISVMEPGGIFYNGITNYLYGRLNTSVTNFTTTDVMQLGKAFWLSNLPATYTNPAIVTAVIAANDYFASNFFADPDNAVSAGGNEGWGGRFGNLGWAIDLLLPELQSSLNVSNDYGAGGNISRAQAWGQMLQGSRDYGRTNEDDWDLSNQGLIANTSIYWANRGMLDLDDTNAFSESNAQKYLEEAVGITPWLGDDLPDGGHDYYHGTNYYQITAKGLSREWGYVGTAYGEMQFYAADFYSWTTNPVFLAQCIKMAKARANFRRPSMEVTGTISGTQYYQDMEGIGLLAWRGADESDTEFADEMAYCDRGAWALGMRCAAVTMDTNLIGYAKQMLGDNEYFNNLTLSSSYYNTIGSQIDSRDVLNAFADYQTVANASDSGVRLPMTTGQPDYAWSDEDDGIVAIKHNGELLWIAAYWQAKTGTAVNGIGRFYDSTSNFDRYGVLETSPQIDFSGNYFVRPNLMDKPEENFYVPPDDPFQAYQGEILPVAANDPFATDDQPFRGKALFWACRYGNYLVGINRSTGNTYQLQTPVGFTSATNLINGQSMTAPVYVAPESTVILYLSSPTNSNPVPMAPLALMAAGNSTPAIELSWTLSSGATRYNVKRSSVSGGPYTIIANVTGTNYSDTSVKKGDAYYYVVSGTNGNGESYYNSMEAFASAGLPSPWNDIDVGAVGTPGGANYSFGTLTVEGAGSDIGGTADSFNFAYVSVTNNCAIVAHLATQQASGSGLDKVGIMLRETTNANAQVQGLILDLELKEARFPMRYGTGSSMQWQQITNAFVGPPLWFLLTRTNNVFTGYVSTNGSTWIPVGTNTILIATNYYAGLAVCSRTTSALDVSTFDNVTTTGWSSPSPDTPTGLTAASGSSQVVLTWNASTNANNYNLARSTTNGGPYSVLGSSLTMPSFTDTDVSNGTAYYYVVSSINPIGQSAYSSQVMAQPVSLSPVSINVETSGQKLQLSWPQDHTSWLLEAQTDSLSSGLGTNWVVIPDSGGTNTMSFSITQTNGSVFFRLFPP